MIVRKLSLAILLAAQLMAITAWAEPSDGEKKVARTLMTEGRLLRDEKDDLRGAVTAFQKAHDIMHVPTTAIELVRTQVKLGMLREALVVIAEVRSMPVNAADPAPFAQARTELDAIYREIDPKVAAVTIALSPDSEIREVLIDGTTTPRAVLSAPLRLVPGAHVFVARGEPGREATERVELVEGARVTVRLTLPAKKVDEPPPTAAPVPVATTPAWRQPIPLTGMGVAGVGLIVGSITGAVALSKASSAKDLCVDNRCPLAAHDDVRSGRTFATVSTVSFVLAGLGAATAGVAIYLGQKKTEPNPTTSPAAPSPPLTDVSLILGPLGGSLRASF